MSNPSDTVQAEQLQELPTELPTEVPTEQEKPPHEITLIY